MKIIDKNVRACVCAWVPGTCVSVRLKWAWNDRGRNNNNSFPGNFHSLSFLHVCGRWQDKAPHCHPPPTQPWSNFYMHISRVYILFYWHVCVQSECVWLGVTQKARTPAHSHRCVSMPTTLCPPFSPFFMEF